MADDDLHRSSESGLLAHESRAANDALSRAATALARHATLALQNSQWHAALAFQESVELLRRSVTTASIPHPFVELDASGWGLEALEAERAEAVAAEMNGLFNRLTEEAFASMAHGVSPVKAVAHLRSAMEEALQLHADPQGARAPKRAALKKALGCTFGKELAESD